MDLKLSLKNLNYVAILTAGLFITSCNSNETNTSATETDTTTSATTERSEANMAAEAAAMAAAAPIVRSRWQGYGGRGAA